MITMKDFYEGLSEAERNLPVVMAMDSEGNGFNPLTTNSWGTLYYNEKEREVYNCEDIDEDNECIEVLVLWP